MKSDPMHFYFDFISPFGYFASLKVDEVAARHGKQVEWHPMLLGISVLKVMNIPPILSLPLKGAYLVRDAERYVREHGVPFCRPSSTPPSRPVDAGRAFAWAKTVDEKLAKSLARIIYHRYFVSSEDIGDMAVVLGCIREAGLSSEAYEAAVQSGEAASIFRISVDRSIARGVFGSPFFLVGDEPFFGVEKMPVLEEWLRTGGW